MRYKYWIVWGLSFAFGIALLAIRIDYEVSTLATNYRPICSPVVGCMRDMHMLLIWVLSGVVFVISIVFLFIRLFYKNKKKLVTPIILVACSFFTIYDLTAMGNTDVESRIIERVKVLAIEIQNICIKNQQCPILLTDVSEDFRLITLGEEFTDHEVGDEIDPASDEMMAEAGYPYTFIGNHEVAYQFTTYKLIPFYGYIAFDYIANDDLFKLSWIAKESDQMVVTVSGGASSALIETRSCSNPYERCNAGSRVIRKANLVSGVTCELPKHSVLYSYPSSQHTLQAQLDIAYGYYRQEKFCNALTEFESILQSYPLQHSVVPYTKYMRCKSFEAISRSFINNLGAGKAHGGAQSVRDTYFCYMDLIAEFPQSDYAADGKAKLLELKNALARWHPL